MKKLSFLAIIFFITSSLHALELKGAFYQGNYILGKTDSRAKVFIDKKENCNNKRDAHCCNLT